MKKKIDENLKSESTEKAVAYIFDDSIPEKGSSKLRVLKEIHVVDVAGEYGTYHVENGKVKSKDLLFKTENDVKAVFNERKKLLIEQANKEENEVLQVMKTFR